MKPELTSQERIVQMIEDKIKDMKARADILALDGQALCAKAETIRAEAIRLQNDLYRFQTNN